MRGRSARLTLAGLQAALRAGHGHVRRTEPVGADTVRVVNAPVTGDSLASFVASARGAKLAGPASATGYGSPAPPSSSAPPAPTPKPAASAASTLDSAIDYSLLVCLAFALGSLVL